MSKMIFVNLPVHDLAASTKLYLALGGELNPQFSNDQASSVMFSESIGVMLLTHEHYRQFTSARSATRGAKARRCWRSPSTAATLSTGA